MVQAFLLPRDLKITTQVSLTAGRGRNAAATVKAMTFVIK